MGAGNLEANKRNVPMMVIHRDELATFLKRKRPHVSLEPYEEEWFTVNKLVTRKIVGWHAIHRAMERGQVKAGAMEVLHPFIHRDELNRFLRESPIRPKAGRENIGQRVEVTYTPIFTGVQSSLGRNTRQPGGL
jgi:hypothetical protein